MRSQEALVATLVFVHPFEEFALLPAEVLEQLLDAPRRRMVLHDGLARPHIVLAALDLLQALLVHLLVADDCLLVHQALEVRR